MTASTPPRFTNLRFSVTTLPSGFYTVERLPQVDHPRGSAECYLSARQSLADELPVPTSLIERFVGDLKIDGERPFPRLEEVDGDLILGANVASLLAVSGTLSLNTKYAYAPRLVFIGGNLMINAPIPHLTAATPALVAVAGGVRSANANPLPCIIESASRLRMVGRTSSIGNFSTVIALSRLQAHPDEVRRLGAMRVQNARTERAAVEPLDDLIEPRLSGLQL